MLLALSVLEGRYRPRTVLIKATPGESPEAQSYRSTGRRLYDSGTARIDLPRLRKGKVVVLLSVCLPPEPGWGMELWKAKSF